MGVAARRFSYAAIGQVVFGRGRAALRLAELRESGEIRRALLVVGARVAADTVATVARALGTLGVQRLDVGPDLPTRDGAQALADGVRAFDAQAIVALGDETVMEVAKGSILALGARRPRVYCIPVELAGAEFSSGVELVDRDGRRSMRRDPALHPDAVLLDAELAASTPPSAWAASGLRLLDHAVERILSRDHLILVDARLVAGVRLIDAFLASSVHSTTALAEDRERLLGALWLIQSNAGNVRGGFSHSLSRELRARYGAPLAAGSSVFLPAVLRWCASAATDRRDVLARAFAPSKVAGVGDVIARLEALVIELRLPTRLRDLGVPSADLAAIAEACLADPNVAASPWRPRDARELGAKLAELW